MKLSLIVVGRHPLGGWLNICMTISDWIASTLNA